MLVVFAGRHAYAQGSLDENSLVYKIISEDSYTTQIIIPLLGVEVKGCPERAAPEQFYLCLCLEWSQCAALHQHRCKHYLSNPGCLIGRQPVPSLQFCGVQAGSSETGFQTHSSSSEIDVSSSVLALAHQHPL